VQQLPDASAVAALSLVGRAYNDARFLMQIGREALKRGFPFDEEAFPVEGFPDPPQIGVEAALVYGISRQESTFDPRAMSPVGARGLMQLMVTTAQETAKRNVIGFDADRLLDDPPYNVLIGTTHLGELLETWGGSYVLTIASYNAGSANTKKWVDAYGDPRTGTIDPVHFVERIPFSETRNYVQRVLENIQVYRMRLNGAEGTQLTLDLVR
jgi:soluble lytic murein transglycosylase